MTDCPEKQVTIPIINILLILLDQICSSSMLWMYAVSSDDSNYFFSPHTQIPWRCHWRTTGPCWSYDYHFLGSSTHSGHCV